MMREICLLACVALLSGCASDVVYKPQTVEVPVAVPCHVPTVERPAMPAAAIKSDAPMFDRVRALLQEREIRQAYERQLEAAVGACG